MLQVHFTLHLKFIERCLKNLGKTNLERNVMDIFKVVWYLRKLGWAYCSDVWWL